jgi:hypothetical protein
MRMSEGILARRRRHLVPCVWIVKDVIDKHRDPRIAVTSAESLLHRLDHATLDIFKCVLASLGPVAGQMVQQRYGWRFGKYQGANHFPMSRRQKQGSQSAIRMTDHYDLAEVQDADERRQVFRIHDGGIAGALWIRIRIVVASAVRKPPSLREPWTKTTEVPAP